MYTIPVNKVFAYILDLVPFTAKLSDLNRFRIDRTRLIMRSRINAYSNFEMRIQCITPIRFQAPVGSD